MYVCMHACVCVCVCVCVYVCSRGTAAIAKTIGCKHDVTMCMMMWHTVWWCDIHTHICDTLYDDVTHTDMCVSHHHTQCHIVIHTECVACMADRLCVCVTSSYTVSHHHTQLPGAWRQSEWPEWQTGYEVFAYSPARSETAPWRPRLKKKKGMNDRLWSFGCYQKKAEFCEVPKYIDYVKPLQSFLFFL